MSFIQVKLSGIKEPKSAPEGNYALSVVDLEGYVKKENNAYVLRLSVVFVDFQKNYRRLTHYLSMPGPNDSEDTIEIKQRMLKRFLVASGCPHVSDGEADGFDEEDLMGLAFNCDVVQDEPNDNGDVYNSLKLPLIPEGTE